MPNNRMSGNKGEWSELYAFLRLLADGRVFAADEHTRRIDDTYYPILKIVREEQRNNPIDYVINDDRSCVDIVVGGEVVGTVPRVELSHEADVLLYEIGQRSGSFEIAQIADFANSIFVYKVKAPATDKTDISMQIEDVHTSTKQDVGFSIKSELGHPPTLLNAGKSTNFVFAVRGLTPDDVARINGIETTSKIRDRMGAIYSARGSFEFRGTANHVFEDNLVLVDSLLPDILADLLLVSYSRDVMVMKELVEILENENPRRYRRPDVYAYKVRKMLCACALGMKPATRWDGSEEANGGYIVVKETGEILAYHIYNREAFEKYLLENTRLERASTGRHDYLSLYEEDGETKIKLNLQIRFV